MRTVEGVYAAAITPRRLGSQDINLAATWDLIDFLVSHGVSGIVLHGSTGEFLHFANSERMRVMGLAPKRSRVPVLVNVSHSTLDGAVEMAQAAMASGAAGVLIMPPYFFRYGSEDIEAFCHHFVDQAGLDIPIYLYNIPAFTSDMDLHLLERLLASGKFAGLKDSSGNEENFLYLRALRERHPFKFMMGSDPLFALSRGRGLDAAVSGVASAVPELMTALDRAMRKDVPEVVTRLEVRLGQFVGWLDKFPVPVAIREAVSLRGIKAGPPAAPLSAAELRTLDEFRTWFKAWLPDVQKECKHA